MFCGIFNKNFDNRIGFSANFQLKTQLLSQKCIKAARIRHSESHTQIEISIVFAVPFHLAIRPVRESNRLQMKAKTQWNEPIWHSFF